MKQFFALLVFASALLALSAAAGEEGPFLPTAFGWEDIQAMNRTAQAFLCESGAVQDAGQVEFFVLRGASLDALSPDLQAALGGRRAVCIGQYRSGGVPHRALYSLDDPPAPLGVFRQEAGGRWTECPGEVPLPDAATERNNAPDAFPLPSRNYEPAAEIGDVKKKRTESENLNSGGLLLKLASDALWRALFH